MSSCNEIYPKIQLYVDGELTGEECEDLFSHLEGCSACRAHLETREALSARIRAARPEVKAPDALRQSVLKKLVEKESLAKEPKSMVRPHLVPRKRPHVRWWSAAAVATILMIVMGGALVLNERQKNRAGVMIETAVLAHNGIRDGQLPLDISSDSPKAVSEWFANRVSFPFQMANDGIASDDRAKYKLAGGRVMTVSGERVALISFRIKGEAISMLVGPGPLATASGGTLVRVDGLMLHTHERDSLHVVTWNNRGLSYVMISKGSMGGTHKCRTCHESRPSDKGIQDETSRLSRRYPQIDLPSISTTAGAATMFPAVAQ
jgi:anti-sigma factor (TIGR02949 family)